MPQPALLKHRDVPRAFAGVLFSDTKYARCWTEIHNWSHEGRKLRVQEPAQNVFLCGEISFISIACGRGGGESHRGIGIQRDEAANKNPVDVP